MPINLYEHQKKAVKMLKSGSILVGGVGSGKTITALAYFVTEECGGKLQINQERGWAPMKNPKPLYVIATARKRDTKDWEHEAIPFLIDDMTVDSWNNLHKYTHVKNAFFIFDEQRLVGSGQWVKSFLKIAQNNHWILLSATPGDSWMDYIPVMVANGFYKNRTEFLRRHVIFSRFSRYPKVDRYIEISRLIKIRDSIVVPMRFSRKTVAHDIDVFCDFDRALLDTVRTKRWNIFTDKPIKDISELCYAMRRVCNSHLSRLNELEKVYLQHKRVIVFYNFNYELDALCKFCQDREIIFAQWNGHKHENTPVGEKWIYLLQYAAASESWNCITTNCIVFFSQNYSYKNLIQAAGRVDRINTTYTDLYYYYFFSTSVIDLAIKRALRNKEDFNEYQYSKI